MTVSGDIAREVARQLSQALGQPKSHTAPGVVESITLGPPAVALVRMDGSSGAADAIPVSAPDPTSIGAHVLITFDGRGGAVIGGNAPFGIPTGTELPWIWARDDGIYVPASYGSTFINASWETMFGSGPETGIRTNADGTLSILEYGFYGFHCEQTIQAAWPENGDFVGFVDVRDNVSGGTSDATATLDGFNDTNGADAVVTTDWMSVCQPSDTFGLPFANNSELVLTITRTEIKIVRFAVLPAFQFED